AGRAPAGRVPPRGTGDPAAGMCACPAQVEAPDPAKPVARVAEAGTPREELVERVLAVHRMPAGEAVLVLEVGRRYDVARHDSVRDAGRKGLELAHGLVGHSVARRLVPVSVPEVAWRVLEQDGH